MSFIDSFHWGWVIMPLFLKIAFWAILIRSLFYIFRNFVGGDMTLLFCEIVMIIFILWTISFIPPHPTATKVISLYENGEIDKSEMKKFLPYAIEFDKEEVKIKEDTLRLQMEKNTIEEAEVKKKKEQQESRRKEAEEYLKLIEKDAK